MIKLSLLISQITISTIIFQSKHLSLPLVSSVLSLVRFLSSLDSGGDRESSPQAHALVSVDEQSGGFVAEVGLQTCPDAQQGLVRALGRGYLRAQYLHGLLEIANFFYEPGEKIFN